MTSGNSINSFSNRCWTPDDPQDAEFKVPGNGSDVISPDEVMNFGVRLDIPTTVGNSIQGDGLSFDLTFTFDQV